MKKKYFITFFITLNIILIFLQVHKHTLFIKNNYTLQQCEKEIAILTEKKQLLQAQLNALKDRTAIKKFAYEKLHMQPFSLKNVKRLEPS